jgi:hypothetical protein
MISLCPYDHEGPSCSANDPDPWAAWERERIRRLRDAWRAGRIQLSDLQPDDAERVKRAA